ncbi:MAG TPA: hypothetical protein VFB25_11635 [Gaiellaceae bacterium]|nr:hypothetical protein [Gaiellaceae bacterium]
MSSVDFPEMRQRLFIAASSLCDQEFQDRLWRRGERLNDQEEGFDDAILFVIDELDWPAPSELVGSVLIDDSELAAFQRLSGALRDLVRSIGQRGTFEDAVATGGLWRGVREAAYSLKTLLG